MRKKRYSLREIARALHRAVSSISDELQRNKVRGKYDAKKARHKARVRRQNAKYQGMKIVENDKLQDFVEELLYDDQSPAAIAGRLKRLRLRPTVSRDSIYRYVKSVYGRKIEYHRSKLKRKRKRWKPRTKPWHDRVFIDKRPISINVRRYVGDAEGDFIVSGKSGRGILLVVVDRKLRAVFLEQIVKPSLSAVTEACTRIKRRYGEWMSMTADNDLLFQHHKELERKIGIRIYFCHPYHAWEKGTVENTNKYIRRYIPKSSDISRYTKNFVGKLEVKSNRRIMEVLNHRTPQEVLDTHRKRKKRASAVRKS